MVKIFISYSSKDRSLVENLASTLQQQGYDVWWDREITGGEQFDTTIEDALINADCVIVVWSESSLQSGWVRAEAEEALKRKKLLPVLLHSVSPPLRFRQLHTIDLQDWFIRPATGGLQPLAKAINQKTGQQKTYTAPRYLKLWDKIRYSGLASKVILACLVLAIIFLPHISHAIKQYSTTSKLVSIIETDYQKLSNFFNSYENQPRTKEFIRDNSHAIAEKILDLSDEYLSPEYKIIKYEKVTLIYIRYAILKLEARNTDAKESYPEEAVRKAILLAKEAYELWHKRDRRRTHRNTKFLEADQTGKRIIRANAIAHALNICIGNEESKQETKKYINLLDSDHLKSYPIENKFMKPYTTHNEEESPNAPEKPEACT